MCVCVYVCCTPIHISTYIHTTYLICVYLCICVYISIHLCACISPATEDRRFIWLSHLTDVGILIASRFSAPKRFLEAYTRPNALFKPFIYHYSENKAIRANCLCCIKAKNDRLTTLHTRTLIFPVMHIPLELSCRQ